jgi:DNA mismatch endonuclease (patch repair protein)
MQAVKSNDTAPELSVRRMVHAMGYRFRLHCADLPGKPDLVFRRQRKVVFVHGCFWHGHGCARGSRVPRSNNEYWTAKIGRNVTRDERSIEALVAMGWKTLIIWECELRDSKAVDSRLRGFLSIEKV